MAALDEASDHVVDKKKIGSLLSDICDSLRTGQVKVYVPPIGVGGVGVVCGKIQIIEADGAVPVERRAVDGENAEVASPGA